MGLGVSGAEHRAVATASGRVREGRPRETWPESSPSGVSPDASDPLARPVRHCEPQCPGARVRPHIESSPSIRSRVLSCLSTAQTPGRTDSSTGRESNRPRGRDEPESAARPGPFHAAESVRAGDPGSVESERRLLRTSWERGHPARKWNGKAAADRCGRDTSVPRMSVAGAVPRKSDGPRAHGPSGRTARPQAPVPSGCPDPRRRGPGRHLPAQARVEAGRPYPGVLGALVPPLPDPRQGPRLRARRPADPRQGRARVVARAPGDGRPPDPALDRVPVGDRAGAPDERPRARGAGRPAARRCTGCARRSATGAPNPGSTPTSPRRRSHTRAAGSRGPVSGRGGSSGGPSWSAGRNTWGPEACPRANLRARLPPARPVRSPRGASGANGREEGDGRRAARRRPVYGRIAAEARARRAVAASSSLLRAASRPAFPAACAVE